MERPKKKPEYDSGKILEQLMNRIVDVYMSGADGESANSLRQISEQFGITLMKTRKILITAGVYQIELSDQVISLKENGKKHFRDYARDWAKQIFGSFLLAIHKNYIQCG